MDVSAIQRFQAFLIDFRRAVGGLGMLLFFYNIEESRSLL